MIGQAINSDVLEDGRSKDLAFHLKNVWKD